MPNQLRHLIGASGRIVFFTGAGISTESGIPDFRSPTGIWTQNKPIAFRDFIVSEEARRETWRRKFITDPTIRAAEPNRGHRAVASLIRQGHARSVITQNIDGLHQQSGVSDARVIELHGNTTYALCLNCGKRSEIDDLREPFERTGAPPVCDDCLGYIKTATISFGQPMPAAAMRQAKAETLAADLFIVAGSSLVVHPAAGFPLLAKENGARLVIVNNEPTPLDKIADLVLRAGIGNILGDAVGVN